MEISEHDSEFAKIKVAYSGNINNSIGNMSIENVDFISIDIKSDDEINDALKGADLVFIVADDKTDIVAALSKKLGTLTIAIIDSDNISIDMADTFFVIDNTQKSVVPNIIKSISDLIAVPGIVNLDLVDIKSMFENAGRAFVRTGEAVGKHAIVDAVKAAIDSIDNISKSRSILLNILGAVDSLSMMEVNEASTLIQMAVHEDAEIIWGLSVDESLGDKIKATIIATNFA